MAINYLKNVMKSVTYAAMDITGEFTPNTKEFAETNKEFTTATFSALKNPKSFVAKQITSIQESKVYKAVDYGVKNLFEDLRTGNYYNKARKERDELALAGFDTNWDDLSEFGIEDDWEKNISSSDSSAEITAGDMKIVEAIEGSNEASTNATVNAVIATSQREVQTSRVNTGILYNQNERLFGGIHKDITILGGTLDKMHAMQSAALQNMDKNMSEFFTQETKLSQERNRILQEMLDLQKQYYQGANKKQDTKKSTQIRWGDININGMPDMDAYFKAVKKNISNQVSSLGFGGFGEDSNMLAQFMISPMEHVVKFAVNGIIPATIKAASKELDATLSGLFGNMIARLSNAKEANDGGGILGIVAKFLGINTSVNRNIDTSKYEKGPIPFDGITRKAIIDVIPTHLRRIEAALTGNQEEMFDYQSGKWVKVSSIKKQLDDVRKNAVNRGTEEIYSAMQPGIRAVKAGMTKKDDAESFDRAVEQFRQFLAAKRGIFNPKLSADANGIDRTLYPDLYKHYSKIKTVFGNVGVIESKDRNGNVTKRYTRQSVKMNVSSNVLNALEEEERFYREAESSADSIYSRFASVGGNYDKHGKYDKKNNKFNPFGRLNQDKDELGNTVFNYLQNINKELQWMRINIPNIVQMPSRGGRGKNKYSKASTAKLTSINDINLRNPSFKIETPMDRIREEEDYKKRALSKIAKDKDGTADLRIFEQDELEYLLQLQDIMRNASVEEYKSEIEGYNANTLSKFMDKHFYKTNIKSRKDVEAAIKKADKEGKKTNEVKFDEKEESFFKKIINRVTNGGETILGGILGASADTFTNLLYAADKAIYDMMFKAELRDSEDGKKYDGFMNAMVGKMTSTFKSIKESFFKEFVDPLKERLGIGDDFKDRFKDSLKSTGSRLWTSFKNANAEVYSPVIDEIKTGYENIKTPKYISRIDRRTEINNHIRNLNNAKGLADKGYKAAMAAAGRGTDKYYYASVEKGREAAMPSLVKELFRNSKNLSDDDLTKDEIDIVLEYITDKKTLSKIASTNKITIPAEIDDIDDIREFIRVSLHDRISRRKKNVKNSKLFGKERSNFNEEELGGMKYYNQKDYDNKKKQILANARRFGIEDEIIKKIEEAENRIKIRYMAQNDEVKENKAKWNALDTIYADLYTKFHAKGTTGRPFTGLTTLTKGEGLISGSGVGVVPKTGIYNVTTPTHIINTEDMHSITGGPRVSVQQALGKERLAAKAAGYNIASHADGTDRVKGEGANAELKIDDKTSIKGKDILQQAKLYLPEAAGGGLIGGILSLVLGLAGGPLVGAALGAGGSIIASSDMLKDKLFGRVGEDGKRDGGIVPKSIMKAYNRYFPDMAKYGLAGLIPGLITPLGPIGGILAGAAFGFIKNNEHFTDKYFGEDGKLTIKSEEQAILKKLFPAAVKGGLIGGLAGMFVPSPFGFVGNAVIGSVLGMMGTTSEFKEMILGTEDSNGERFGGLVGVLKDSISPFTDSLKNAGNKLVNAIEEHVVDPLSKFAKPAIHAIPKFLGIIPRKIGDILYEHTSKIGKTFSTFLKGVLSKPIGLISRMLSPMASVAKRLLSIPGGIINRASDSLMSFNIRRGDTLGMTQRAAVEWMDQHKRSNKVSNELRASAFMGSGEKGSMSKESGQKILDAMKMLNTSERDAHSRMQSENQQLNNVLTSFRREDGTGLSDRTINKVLNASKAGKDNKEISKILLRELGEKDFNSLWEDKKNKKGKIERVGLANAIISAQSSQRILEKIRSGEGAVTPEILELMDQYGIDRGILKDRHKLNSTIDLFNNRFKELATNEENPYDLIQEEKEQQEEENHDNIKKTATVLEKMQENLSKIYSGEHEAIKVIIEKQERDLKAGKDEVDREYANRFNEATSGLSDDDKSELSDSSRNILTRVKGKKGKRILNSYGVKGVNASKGNIKNLNRIFNMNHRGVAKAFRADDKAYEVLSDKAIEYLSTILPSTATEIRKALSKKYVSLCIQGIVSARSKLLTVDELKLLESPINRKTIEKNCLILSQIYNNGNTDIYSRYNKLDDILELDYDDFSHLRSEFDHKPFNRVTNSTLRFKVKLARDIKNNGAVFTKKDDKNEESDDTPEVEQHGIGTTILSTLFNVGKSAVKGAASLAGKGIKSLFTRKDKESRDGANAGLLAALGSGILNMAGGRGSKQDGGELDETDKKGDGKDAVHVGNGDFIIAERTQDGSIEPDTSDSKTKAVMNKLNLKERALEKLQAAQLKASEVIQKTFDTSDIKESKGGKLGWFALLLGGGLLLKSGILQKLFNSVVKPIWTDHIKPFMTETVLPKISDIWSGLSSWFTQTALPFITENIPKWIGIMAANIIKSIPDIIKGLIEGLGWFGDGITGNRNGAGTKTEVDANNLAETRGSDFETGMTDENGNKLTVADIQNGNYKEIYNAQGIKGTVDENGNVTFKDDSLVGSSAAEATANSSVRAFAKSIGSGKKSKLLDLADRGASRLMKSKGLIKKYAGVATKASFTLPIKGAEKLGLNLHDRWNNYVNKKIDNISRNIFNKEAQKMGGNLTSKEGKELWKRINRGEILDDFDKSDIGIKYHKVKDATTDVADKAKTFFKGNADNVDDAAEASKGLFGTIKDKYNKVKDTVGAPKRFVKNQINKVKDAAKNTKVGQLYTGVKDKITGGIDSVKTGIKNKTVQGLESIKEGFKNKATSIKNKIVGDTAEEAAEKGAKEAVESGAKKAVGKATKDSSGLIGKVATKIKEFVTGIFSNEKVVSKIKDVAEFLGIKDAATWIKNLKNSIDNFLGNAVEGACKKAGTKVVSKIASKVFGWATILIDFGVGMDQAESILGVSETTIVEELVAGLVNALINATIIFSIWPGVNEIARFIYKLIFDDAEKKMTEADAEYEKYKEETGSTLTKEEYLKRQYSATGKLGGYISDRWKDFKNGAKKVGSNIVEGAKKIGSSTVEGAKKIGSGAKKAWNAFTGLFSNANGTISIASNADGSSAIEAVDPLTSMANNLLGAFVSPISMIKDKFDSVSNIISNATSGGLDNDKEANSLMDKAREGKINIFSKEFWKDSKESKDNSFTGSLKRAVSSLNKIVNFPMLMVKSSLENLSTDISSVGEIVTGQSSGSSSSGSSNSSSSGSISNKSSSSGNTFTGKVKSFFSGAASKIKSFFGFGTGKTDGEYEYGTGGYSKQIDSSIAGIRFNSAEDSEYQTIGDSGCGPAAAVNALESIYGRGGKAVVDAAKFAINHGYKETDGGTRPEFFTDYFNSNGLGSQISYNRRQIENNINSGMPTVIMGKDPKGTSPSTPFGRTSHYVTVTGTDGRGNAIVQDPESKYDNQLYPIKNLMNKTTLGVSAYGKGYSNKRHRSGFGRRFGRGIWGLGRFGRGKSKIIFIGDSRTVGMKDAVGSNDHIWSCKSSTGFSWMKATGVPAIENQIDQDTAIVILMGVNDCERSSSRYTEYLNLKAESWTKSGADIYFVSVNPIDESKYNGPITNSTIDTFNSEVKSGLDSSIKWIETNSAIKDSFNASDGLHYDNETYKKIYDIIVSAVSSGASVEVADNSLNTSGSTTNSSNNTASSEPSVLSTFSNIIMQSKAGQALQMFLGTQQSGSTSSTSTGSTTSGASNSGSFPKYNLTEAQKLGIANIVGHEQPGITGYLAEASLIANRTDISGDDKATPENIVKTVTGGWFADGKNRFNNPGSPDPDAIKAVEEVIINGKRTLPRYVDEHDFFGDIASVTNNGTSISNVKDRSQYKQHVSVIKNKMGSTYTFYEFPNDQADPFGYIGTENRQKWGEDHYDAKTLESGFGKNYGRGKGKGRRRFGRGRFGRGSAEQVWWYAKTQMGLTDAGAAGLLGNMYHESGVDPKKVELLLLNKLEEDGISYDDDSYTNAVDSGEIDRETFIHPRGGSTQYGYGLVQWTSPGIKGELYDNAKNKNVSISDIGNQCDTLNQQLNSSYAEVLDVLKSTNSVHDASEKFLKGYERPADQSDAVVTKRANKSQEYFDQLQGTEGEPITGVTGASSSGSSSSAQSASDSVISILSSIISNSKAGQALQLFLGGSSSSTSDTSGSTTTSTVGGPMAQRVVQVAEQEVGTKEKSPNYVKYNDWYWGDGVGGDSYPWCAAFVSWVMNQAGVPQEIFKKDAYTVTSYQDTVSKGQKVDNASAVPGDVAYFTKTGDSSGIYHIGIVKSNNGGTIHTIEGNSSDMVKENEWNTNSSKLLIARPPYTGGSPTSGTLDGSTSSSSTSSSTAADAPDVENTLGSNGVKPLSRYGQFKESIYGRGSNSRKKKMMSKNGYVTMEEGAMDRRLGEAIKTNSRKHVYNKYPASGRGTAVVEPKFHAAGTTDTVANSKLLNTIISILVTIAENTDKLNMIVSILNDKLNINITESDISKAKEDSQSLKSRLSEAINANSNLSRFNSYADNVADSSINSIISAMNAIASE